MRLDYIKIKSIDKDNVIRKAYVASEKLIDYLRTNGI